MGDEAEEGRVEVSGHHRSGDTGLAPYRGPDRRGRTPVLTSELKPSRVLPLTFLIFAASAAPALFLLIRDPSLASVVSYVRMAAGLLAVVAGAAALVSWRISGRSLHGWLGTAFVAFGTLTAIDSGFLSPGGVQPTAHPTDVLVRAVITGALLWKAVSDREVNSSFAPLVALVTSIGGGMVAMGALDLLQVNHLLPEWATSRGGYVSIYALSAAMWLFVTFVALRIARRGRRGVPWWIAAASGLLGLAVVLRVGSPYGWGTMLASAWLVLLAVSLAVGMATTRLREALRHEDGRQLGLHRTVDALRSQVAAEQDQLAEWLHD
ncbi:MAG: hypothetical protein ACRDV8_05605, partial [Acidimicrobiales bacterium]